ncbi:hypothetical protein JW905_03790 [bacterium]|nr:hypothetical protein [candidate division CSSED10-310 bacterium]
MRTSFPPGFETVLVLVLAVLAAAPAMSDAADPAAGPVRIESAVDRSSVTMGDRIEYVITITAEPGVHIEPPSPGENLGAFELRDYHIEGPLEEAGQIYYRAVYGISIYEVGEHAIPPVKVSYRRSAEAEWEDIGTQPIVVRVASIAPEDGQFRDIKQVREIPRDHSRLYRLLGILAAVILVIAATILLLRSRRRRRQAPAEPPRPPHLVALEALRRLEQSDLLGEGEFKRFHVELAQIIKTYLGARFDILTIERTSEEIVGDLSSAATDTRVTGYVEQLLAGCDLVKFAAFQPSAETAMDTLALGRTIVEETRLRIALDSVLSTAAPVPEVRDV